MRPKNTIASADSLSPKSGSETRQKSTAPFSPRSGGGKPTIAQVAKEAKVSVATVSRLVNKTPCYMSPVTRRRVEEAIERLQYTPNRLVRSLQRGRSDVIAYIGQAMGQMATDEFVVSLLNEICRAASEKHYDVLVPVGSIVENGLPTPATLMDGRCDGFIVGGHNVDALMATLADRGFPIVELWARNVPPGVGSVQQGVADGVAKAMEHLFGLGHRRIAHFAGPLNLHDTAHFRMEEYFNALRRAGIEPDEELVMPRDGSASWAVDNNEVSASLDHWIRLADQPTAVLCTSDRVAIALINIAAARGIRVPEDLSVVGFDDVSLARFSTPPLTTVSVPIDRIAAEAVSMLVRMIDARNGGEHDESPEDVPMVSVVEAELVIRESTAPPRPSSKKL